MVGHLALLTGGFMAVAMTAVVVGPTVAARAQSESTTVAIPAAVFGQKADGFVDVLSDGRE